MTQKNLDIKFEILNLLGIAERRGGRLPELINIATALGDDVRPIRRVCDDLEAEGLLRAAHTLGADPNPSYWISNAGKLYLLSL